MAFYVIPLEDVSFDLKFPNDAAFSPTGESHLDNLKLGGHGLSLPPLASLFHFSVLEDKPQDPILDHIRRADEDPLDSLITPTLPPLARNPFLRRQKSSPLPRNSLDGELSESNIWIEAARSPYPDVIKVGFALKVVACSHLLKSF